MDDVLAVVAVVVIGAVLVTVLVLAGGAGVGGTDCWGAGVLTVTGVATVAPVGGGGGGGAAEGVLVDGAVGAGVP